jgi:hypothetical protein
LTCVNEGFAGAGNGPPNGNSATFLGRRVDFIGAKTWRKQVQLPRRRHRAANP